MLIPIQYGKIDLSSGHWEDSIVTYYCDKDYAMIGTATRKCQATGKWTGTDPECIYGMYLYCVFFQIKSWTHVFII